MKKIKGFTLIECLVAMAIIGITSLLMVQVYGTAARLTQENNQMNNSIERQMQYAEKQLTEVAAQINGSPNPDKDAVKIIHLSSYGKSGAKGNVGQIKIRMEKEDNPEMFNKLDVGKGSSNAVKVDVDMYVIGIDTSVANGQAIDDYRVGKVAETYDNNNARYKFIIPKEHPKT